MNDTYVEQISSAAEAAINLLDARASRTAAAWWWAVTATAPS